MRRYLMKSYFSIWIVFQSLDFKTCTNCSWPKAWRNSVYVNGYILSISTFPTGADSPWCIVMPNNEPATATWCCDACSQKYFNAVKPFFSSCISSRIIKVFPAMMGTLVIAPMASIMRSMS